MALQYYELAVEIDSTYAPAYAGIALVWGGGERKWATFR